MSAGSKNLRSGVQRGALWLKQDVLVTGLNAGMFVFKNIHVMIGLFPLFCSLRKWVESVVLFSGVGISRLDLCLLYLAFKYFARPTYVWVLLPP